MCNKSGKFPLFFSLFEVKCLPLVAICVILNVLQMKGSDCLLDWNEYKKKSQQKRKWFNRILGIILLLMTLAGIIGPAYQMLTR